MSSITTHSIAQHGTSRLEILDLPADAIFLIFSSLHGQDIAKCTMVNPLVLLLTLEMKEVTYRPSLGLPRLCKLY